MLSSRVTLTGLGGLPLVEPGDRLAQLLAAELRRLAIVPQDRDILVVAQKIVSKSEGRFVDLRTVEPSPRAIQLAQETGKNARLVEVILSESTEVIRHKKDVLIVAHRQGYIMANAGVDQSNVGPGNGERVLLLPLDCDSSAASLKLDLDREFGVDFGIVINDSFGRPWRNGVIGVALGAAGIPSLQNLIGKPDLFDRKLRVTEIAIADELAAAGSLLMGQSDEGIPAVHIRGFTRDGATQPASVLVRPKEQDLFR